MAFPHDNNHEYREIESAEIGASRTRQGGQDPRGVMLRLILDRQHFPGPVNNVEGQPSGTSIGNGWRRAPTQEWRLGHLVVL